MNVARIVAVSSLCRNVIEGRVFTAANDVHIAEQFGFFDGFLGPRSSDEIVGSLVICQKVLVGSSRIVRTRHLAGTGRDNCRECWQAVGRVLRLVQRPQ